jgi:exopolyphosphatase/guanosine-5'-triphosphate,3'-diphosphate pyrophosphatase
MTQAVAAIDCGSNSFRLLIRRSDGTELRRSVVCGLSRGLGSSGILNDDALERARLVLVDFAQVLGDEGVKTVRVTSTEAARRATNVARFHDIVRETLDTQLIVLDGITEATLSFRGAVSRLSPDVIDSKSTRTASTYGVGPFFDLNGAEESVAILDDVILSVDIGGASTELGVGRSATGTSGPGASDQVSGFSIPLGGVVATETYFLTDPPLPEDLSNVFGIMHTHLEDAVRERPLIAQAGHLVAVGGSACDIAAIEKGVPWGESQATSGVVLSRSDVEEVFRMLAADTTSERAHHPGMRAERAEVVVAGCVLLLSVMRRFGFQHVIVSEHDLLDALVDKLIAESIV